MLLGYLNLCVCVRGEKEKSCRLRDLNLKSCLLRFEKTPLEQAVRHSAQTASWQLEKRHHQETQRENEWKVSRYLMKHTDTVDVDGIKFCHRRAALTVGSVDTVDTVESPNQHPRIPAAPQILASVSAPHTALAQQSKPLPRKQTVSLL